MLNSARLQRFIIRSLNIYNNVPIIDKNLYYQSRRQIQKIQQEPEDLSNSSSENYCINLVRKHDYENFLCTLLLRDQVQRRQAFALRAFNVEIAKCSLNVTEPQIIQMRIQFWLDAIDKCYEDKNSYVANQPVLKEIKSILHSKPLNRVYLKRLVSARNRQPNQQFRTIDEIQQYTEETYSSLFYLLLECFGIKNVNVDHAASHLGKAQGLTTLLRAIPHLHNGFSLHIPQELLIKHNVSYIGRVDLSIDEEEKKAIQECVFEIASLANQHLKKSRLLMDKLPKSAIKLFLPGVVVDRYLERLRKADFNLTNVNCLRRDTLLPLILFLHSFRGLF